MKIESNAPHSSPRTIQSALSVLALALALATAGCMGTIEDDTSPADHFTSSAASTLTECEQLTAPPICADAAVFVAFASNTCEGRNKELIDYQFGPRCALSSGALGFQGMTFRCCVVDDTPPPPDDCAATKPLDKVGVDVTGQITCPTPLTLECNGGAVSKDDPRIVQWMAQAVATDPCVEPTVSTDAPDLFAPSCSGQGTTVTFTSSTGPTCTSSVTIADTHAPSVSAPPELVIQGEYGGVVEASDPAIQQWLAGAASADQCGSSHVNVSAPSVFPVGCDAAGGTYTVTFTATDSCGNASTATFSVIVTADCPQVVTRCAASSAFVDPDYGPGSGGHSVWAPQFYGNSSTTKMHFNEGTFLDIWDNGTAHLYGTASVFVGGCDGKQYELDVWLDPVPEGVDVEPKLELSGGVQTPEIIASWLYYIISPTDSFIREIGGTGLVTLSHEPADLHYGFQVGEMANGKNLNFGASGWFHFEHAIGGNGGVSSAKGDFNMDLDCQDL